MKFNQRTVSKQWNGIARFVWVSIATVLQLSMTWKNWGA